MNNSTTINTLTATTLYTQHLESTWQRYPRPENLLLDQVFTALLHQVNGTHYDVDVLSRILLQFENIHRLTVYTHAELVDMKVFLLLWNWLYRNTDQVMTDTVLYKQHYLPLMTKVLAAKPRCEKPKVKQSLFLMDY